MKIGIIVAMNKELRLLLDILEHQTEISANEFTFYRGKIDSHDVVVTQCGIGKVNAAMGALTLIETFHPSLIISTGVAGGTGATRPLDVVVADRVAYHDTWCGPGTEWGEMADCPRYFPTADAVVKTALEVSPETKKGLICSGDFFVSTVEEVKRIRQLHPDVMAVDMESAAIAHVCERKNVPFMSVRVISDTPGDTDNIAQYDNFWTVAPETTFHVLSDLISALSSTL